MIDETIDTPEGVVQLELDAVEDMMLRWRMPDGISKRVEENEPESQDLKWFHEVVETATDLDVAKISNGMTLYIVDCVARSIGGTELQSYEEFIGEDDESNFISEGTLGVNND
jgi:hypothetical protein